MKSAPLYAPFGGKFYVWFGHGTPDVCWRSGNYVWRKVVWRIYRCWYED